MGWRLLIVTMGLGLILALGDLISAQPLRTENHRDWFIKVWFVTSLIVIYLPVPFQAMLLNGWQVPISILATSWLFERVVPWCRARWSKLIGLGQWRWMTVVFLFVALTNVYWVAWRITELNHHEHPYYLLHSELAGLNWLEQNASRDDVVLSSLTTGFYLPGIAGVRPLLAHGVYTLDFYRKRDAVEAFSNPNVSDVERQSILNGYGVDYVFYGPSERELGAYRPETAGYLVPAFSNGDVRIFRVNKVR
jgi:hypothetical protein